MCDSKHGKSIDYVVAAINNCGINKAPIIAAQYAYDTGTSLREILDILSALADAGAKFDCYTALRFALDLCEKQK